MSKTPKFSQLVERAKQHDAYWTDRASLEFVVDVYRLMQQQGTTKSALARKLNTSPAYVTKVFRGDTNFTLETMVRLARAVGGRLHVHVAEEDARVRWFDVAQQVRKKACAPDVGNAFADQTPVREAWTNGHSIAA